MKFVIKDNLGGLFLKEESPDVYTLTSKVSKATVYDREKADMIIDNSSMKYLSKVRKV